MLLVVGAGLSRVASSIRRARALRVCVGVLLVAFIVLSADARAQSGEPSARAASAERSIEIVRLRGDLERANADVARLKHEPRGVRADYELRARMADAEALARRLTDAEAHQTTPTSDPARPLVTPNVSAADGPLELDAKADVLVDEARRLSAEADRLARGAEAVRTRDLLRRRAGQLERDPFAGLEASKRSLVFSTGGRSTLSVAPPVTVGRTPTTTGSSGESEHTPPSGATSTAQQAAPSPGTGSSSNSDSAHSTPSAAPEASLSPAAPVVATSSPLSITYRTLLDPGTLADVRRLEADGSPQANAEALARAAAGLRARAQGLNAQAAALRARK